MIKNKFACIIKTIMWINQIFNSEFMKMAFEEIPMVDNEDNIFILVLIIGSFKG